MNSKADYLHDGRARTVDEAIRWHGGEAESAKDSDLALASKDRQILLGWLQGLSFIVCGSHGAALEIFS